MISSPNLLQTLPFRFPYSSLQLISDSVEFSSSFFGGLPQIFSGRREKLGRILIVHIHLKETKQEEKEGEAKGGEGKVMKEFT